MLGQVAGTVRLYFLLQRTKSFFIVSISIGHCVAMHTARQNRTEQNSTEKLDVSSVGED